MLDLETLGLCARISLDTAPTLTSKDFQSIADGTGSVAPSMSLTAVFFTDRALITFHSLFYCRNIFFKFYCPNRTYTQQAQKIQIINERDNSLSGSRQIEGVWYSNMCKTVPIFNASLLSQDLPELERKQD